MRGRRERPEGVSPRATRWSSITHRPQGGLDDQGNPQHANRAARQRAARPRGRRRMVDCVLVKKGSVEATAERFQVDAKTVRKWMRRFREEGVGGLQDRSSRPRSCPWATSPAKRQEVLELRRRRRWGADHIAHVVGLARSTVQSILTAAGVGRLDRGDRATAAPDPVRRYQREHPGELVHVDIKKLAGIPEGGGWRLLGRSGAKSHSGAGYRYLHTAIDDRTRLVYSEIHDDEKVLTAAAFWGTCRRLLRRPRNQGSASPHRQRLLLPLRTLVPSVRWDRDGGQEDTGPPSPDQWKGRTFPSHPAPGVGLRPGPGAQSRSAARGTPGSATSTITTAPTVPSDGRPLSRSSPPSPGTTSPRGTARGSGQGCRLRPGLARRERCRLGHVGCC